MTESLNQSCDFSGSLTCPRCGYVAKTPKTFRRCRQVPSQVKSRQPFMLGNAVESILSSVGITKSLVERITKTSNRPDGCGCDGRKSWLNEIGIAAQRDIEVRMSKVKRFMYGD